MPIMATKAKTELAARNPECATMFPRRFSKAKASSFIHHEAQAGLLN